MSYQYKNSAFSEIEFEAFELWKKNKNYDEYFQRWRYDEAMSHVVIEWVIATNRNSQKNFFWTSLGKDPHNKSTIVNGAENFWEEAKQYYKNREEQQTKEIIKNPKGKSDWDKGMMDGYLLQQKKAATEAYLLGYREGLLKKREEGYIADETEKGCFTPNMGRALLR